jgi:hypothetical protein
MSDDKTDPKHLLGTPPQFPFKPLAVAGATFAVTTPPLMADGNLSQMDFVSIACAIIAAVSALYLKRPESEDSTNG